MKNFRRSLICSVPVIAGGLIALGVTIAREKPAQAQDVDSGFNGVAAGDVFSDKTDIISDSATPGFDRFDPEEYERGKSAYLERSEPGRIYDTLEVNEENSPLERMGENVAYLIPVGGGSEEIAVKTLDDAPVTFTAFGGGIFERNGLTSITVESSRRGRAEAVVSFGPDVYGAATVLAGSPVTSGRVMFAFQIDEPTQRLSDAEIKRLQELRSRDTQAVDSRPDLPELPDGIDLGL